LNTDERNQTIRETLSLVLGIDVPPGSDVSRDIEPSWDSLKHIEVVFALESALDVRFTEEQIGNLTDVGAIVEAIDETST
jgi:acyl carrier protein